MSDTAIVITTIGAITIVAAIAIHSRFKQAHFEMWKEEFTRQYMDMEAVEFSYLPIELNESILRDLYDENSHNIKWAVETYIEGKIKVDWLEVDGFQITERLTVEQILERYDLTDAQIEQLKNNTKNG